MIEFGAALRKAREAANLSLDDLYEKTRINLKHLKAIEAGDFPSVPQTYVRAFIREFARIVGIDEDRTVEVYNEMAEREKGVPKPPEAVDNSNILPQVDDTIEILPAKNITPKHVEVAGRAEVETQDEFIPPVRKSHYITDESAQPIEIRTTPKSTESLHGQKDENAANPLEPEHLSNQSDNDQPAVQLETRDVIPQKSSAHLENKAFDSKTRERSAIFEKMISPSSTSIVHSKDIETTRKQRQSVYDMKPPIPADDSRQTRANEKSTKVEGINSTEPNRLFVIVPIVVLIIAVAVYAFLEFRSEPKSDSDLMDSTSIKASIEAGRFIDTSQYAFIEQIPLSSDSQQVENPKEEKLLEPTPKVFAKEDSLVLEAFTNSPVWFSVKMDTSRSERGSMGTNDHKVWKAKDRFLITLGDAGAVVFFLNGKELGSLGEEGAVIKNVSLSRQNLHFDQ